MTVSVLPGV